MKVNSDITNLVMKSSPVKQIMITYKGKLVTCTDGAEHWAEMLRLYNRIKADGVQVRAITDYVPMFPQALCEYLGIDNTVPTAVLVPSKEDLLNKALTDMIDFFSEFDFTPSYRFTNTLAFLATKATNAKKYIQSYFELMGSSYAGEVREKVKSAEFTQILKNIAQYGSPASHVNTRFKVYYGAAGTGKTTLAQTETENRCIVCNSSMLPSDLMENFVFKDGKPDFNPSMLWECMEQGKPIVLDEINLLPFDSLRFLQGIVDGKTSFLYKNREVHIHDGFQIIGTMNLTLGGVTYGLPEPLVDRCEDIREFKLTAAQLMGAVTGNFVGA